jgi:lipopolysaccharide/colanic/teichoic acid biosynthesis glycosyltransferase
MRHGYFQLLTNLLIALFLFFFSIWVHNGIQLTNIEYFALPAFCFYFVHIFISLANRKYEFNQHYPYKELFKRYIQTWFYSTGLALLVFITFQINWISRQFLLVNIFGLLIGELVFISIVSIVRKSVYIKDPEEIEEARVVDLATLYPDTGKMVTFEQQNQSLKILHGSSHNLQIFIARFFNLGINHSVIFNHGINHTVILDVNSIAPLLGFPINHYQNILNLHRLNNISHINTFLEAANSRLPENGCLMVCAETKNQRKIRFMKKYPPVLNSLFYLVDFMIMRVFPKLPVTRQIYFWITKGNDRVISRAEILGRLYSCGFTIVEEQNIMGQLYVVGQKVKLPVDSKYVTYGPLIYLNRIGKDGKIIKVYKLRTMHAYSEYLQDYVYKQNNLEKGGKIRDDFRVTTIGKLLRKFWIDELPMLWNLLKGDVKLVGVRPISRHYFSLYSADLQKKRIRYKPGLIPPFYADLPETLNEIMASELKYLEQYKQSPWKTDFVYFWKAVFNIMIRGAKSH